MVRRRNVLFPRLVRRPQGRRGTGKESGYTLVVLAVMISVLSILLSKALPVWSHAIQREREEELIFRGLQYAEAIRLFQGRYQRLPVRLEELIEVDKRCIRQLWTNPMAKDGEWALIFQTQKQQGGQGRGGGRDLNPPSGLKPPSGPGGKRKVKTGPIIGVYSPVGDESIKIWNGQQSISQWRFTADLLQGLGQASVATVAGQGQTPDMNSRNIGKPWPPGVTVQRPQGKAPPPRGIGIGQGAPRVGGKRNSGQGQNLGQGRNRGPQNRGPQSRGPKNPGGGSGG